MNTEGLVGKILGSQDETNKLLDYLPVGAMFAFMFLSLLPQIPAVVKPYLMFGGLGVAIGVGILSQELLKFKASEYQVYKATIRPTQKKIQLFVQKSRIELRSQMVDPTRKIYKTEFDLAEPRVFDEEKGKSSRVIIWHQLSWSERMMLTPSCVTYKGFPDLAHNNVADITLWEPDGDKGELDNELMEWVPHFELREAPRDYQIARERKQFIQPAPTQTTITATTQDGNEISLADYMKLEEDRNYWRTQTLTQKQAYVRTQALARDAVNTSFAAFSRTRDMGKLVLEEIVACLHAHADIQEAAREYKPFSLPKFTMALAATIIGLAFLYLVGTNDDFRTKLFANLPVVAVAGILVVVFVWYFKGKIKL